VRHDIRSAGRGRRIREDRPRAPRSFAVLRELPCAADPSVRDVMSAQTPTAASHARDPRSEYQRRIGAWTEVLEAGRRRHLLVSNFRLAVAGSAALVAWLVVGRVQASALWLLAPGV